MRTAAAVLATVAVVGGAPEAGAGEPVWSEVTPGGERPPGRIYHALAYDAARARTVLFGGFDGAGWLADTWEWDGSDWLDRTGGPAPGPRSSFALAYDAARARTVLFGGFDGTEWLGDTWSWDGIGWQQLSADGPPARAKHGLAYDASRDRMVLFGGEAGDTTFADTWEWDGERWHAVAEIGPSPRKEMAMAYDAARAETVLFGGILDEVPLYHADTWVWDGTAWSERVSSPAPSERAFHGLTFDPEREVALLFGGFRDEVRYADTWEWDGAVWSERIVSGPPARAEHALAHDSGRSRTVLFGGGVDGGGIAADTWELAAEATALELACSCLVSCTAGRLVYDVRACNRESTPLRLSLRWPPGPALPSGAVLLDLPLDAATDGRWSIERPIPAGVPVICPATLELEATLADPGGEVVARRTCPVTWVPTTP